MKTKLYALAVIAFSILCWYGYESTGLEKKITAAKLERAEVMKRVAAYKIEE